MLKYTCWQWCVSFAESNIVNTHSLSDFVTQFYQQNFTKQIVNSISPSIRLDDNMLIGQRVGRSRYNSFVKLWLNCNYKLSTDAAICQKPRKQKKAFCEHY
jgi:hypothetical protein